MIKKIVASALIAVSLVATTAFAQVDMEPKPIEFTHDASGKYIYCNNHEFIRRSDLADTSNPNAKYLMNNTLEPCKYNLFVSHVNHTELRDANNAITETGFDIELDVLFKAIEDTEIKITSIGFEVPAHSKYYYNGEVYKREEAWGCMNAWADYIGMPIKELDSGTTYNTHSMDEINLKINAGEKVWLSDYIRNYAPVPFYRPVLLLADFEVVSGKTEANIAAIKSTGTVGDRRFVSPNPAYGAYEPEKQYKGVADYANTLDASLEYTFADWTGGGEFPVIVKNAYVPTGNTVSKWFTHLNPYADPWNKQRTAASDMFEFKYRDDTKLKYYGPDVPEDERDNEWVFAIDRSDFAKYPGKIAGAAYNKYIPNDRITADSPAEGMGNFGNYGVFYNYKVKVTNEGKITRYVNYNLKTTSNNIVILKDENGVPVNDYAICKGEHTDQESDTLACVEVPGGTSRTFTVTVILPTNYVGGMENSLTLTNTKTVPRVYNDSMQVVPKDLSYTGGDYIKWDNFDLYRSYDRVNWEKMNVSPEVEKIFHGNWNQYEFLRAGDGYMVKAALYDSTPYYGIREFFSKIYYLDNNFNLVSEVPLYQYPTEMSYARGTYFVNAGSVYSSADMKEWTLTDGSFDLPRDNGGVFSVRKSGRFYQYSTDGREYYDAVYEGKKPDFIETAGDYYYYINGKNVYVSADGMYFDRVFIGSAVEKLSAVGGKLYVNDMEYDIVPKAVPHISYNGTYLVFDNKPFEKDGRMYAPYNYLRNICGEKSAADKEKLIEHNDEEYIAVADFCAANGFSLSYDAATDCAVIESK